MAKQFSKWLFVTKKKDGDTAWLDANESQVEATENADSDIAVVATYQLVKVNKLRLVKTVASAESHK